MRRRELIAGLAAIGLSPCALAQAQSGPVLGFMYFSSASVATGTSVYAGVHRGLSEAGFDVGRNLTVEYRWADFDMSRLPGIASDLVNRRVSAIYANGAGAGAAAKAATATIPIVFTYGGDPVQDGLVASLARPGGNVTGLTLLTTELGAKRLEILRELLPGKRVFAMLVDPGNADSQAELDRVQRAAERFGQELRVVSARSAGEFEAAFRSATEQHCAAVLVGTGGLFGNNPQQLAALAERYAIPSMFDRREPVDAGGLISYGTNFSEFGRRTGIMIARVLKGERPADLPVEQPTKFELVINLKTAKALGLALPQTLLARADEVIE